MNKNDYIKKMLKLELARQTLAGFLLYTFPGYEMGWVHAEICQKLDDFFEAVKRKESPRLMLMLPPRSGKSEIVSKRFPAYVFGKDPDISIISTSYSADLASRNNRGVQQIIDSDEYREIFPTTTLCGKGNRGIGDNTYLRTSEAFEIVNHKGIYRSAGVGGGITGMGGDILLIDDPIKDRMEADSETIRNKVWDWYTSTLYTRLMPGGGIIVIMTRWHTADLCGKLLEAMQRGTGDKWEVISYPAIATQDELHRKAGEALHPERFPIERLLQIKAAIGSRDWEALYQQSPTVDGGAIFKEEWFKTYTTLPEFDTVIQSWDMTFKNTGTSDFVAGQVWGRKGADCYLIDQIRGRMSFTETLEAFVKLTKKYPKALRKLVEDKANGPAVIDVLKHSVQGIIPIEPDGSKTARAYAVTPMFEAGNVYLPAPDVAPWVRDYKAELTAFPMAAHDDQVDATTQALRELQKNKKMQINTAILQRGYW